MNPKSLLKNYGDNKMKIKKYYSASIAFDTKINKATIIAEALWNEYTDEDDIIDVYYHPNDSNSNIMDFSICLSRSEDEIKNIAPPKFYFKETASYYIKKLFHINDPWVKILEN